MHRRAYDWLYSAHVLFRSSTSVVCGRNERQLAVGTARAGQTGELPVNLSDIALTENRRTAGRLQRCCRLSADMGDAGTCYFPPSPMPMHSGVGDKPAVMLTLARLKRADLLTELLVVPGQLYVA